MAPTDKDRPYAAIGNVMDVLQRYRKKNFPETIDSNAMKAAGVPEGMIGRTLGALRFLGLLTPANEPTDEWRALSNLDDAAFREFLGKIVRAAFRDVFALFDPETDGQDRIRNFFQQYQPKSQIDRMVTLFLGLCAESGIPTRDTPKRRPTKAQTDAGAKRYAASRLPRENGNAPTVLPPRRDTPSDGETKTIKLHGGGTLTLHASVSFFQLPREDRDFVFELLDKLTGYENRRLIAGPTRVVRPEDQETIEALPTSIEVDDA
jgi:Family of unknown function (DUF5343)